MSRIVRSSLIQATNVAPPTASLAETKKAMVDKHVGYIRQAAAQGSQIVCLQEIFYGPYFCAEQQTRWYDFTEAVPGAFELGFDPARILQVLVNLIGNALKFTPAKGSVVVSVEQSGEEIRFSVRDTGRGIPEDQLEAVFERFLQIEKDDRRGVGLGLYISKCIVQGHGGRIWVESRIGEGSEFCFTIPLRTNELQPSIPS